METNPFLQAVFDQVERERRVTPFKQVGRLEVDMNDASYMEPARGPYADFMDAISGEHQPYMPPLQRLKEWARKSGVEVHEDYQARDRYSLTYTCPDNHFFVTYSGDVIAAIRRAREEAMYCGALTRRANVLFLSPQAHRELHGSEDFRYWQMTTHPKAPSLSMRAPTFEEMELATLSAREACFAVAYVTQESVTPQRELSRFSA